jgi:hypothetical protein
MAHDVFISYATDDRQVAEKVCVALEGDGIKCWIAPRDVPVGADYEEAIVDGIASSRILVLVLSSHSNASPTPSPRPPLRNVNLSRNLRRIR